MKLSIITINYNNCSGLQRTIESVISQTWKDFEWIVVDGGSTDGSLEIIKRYASYFSWWCSEPDKGIYNAMNKGISHAKGEYINFLNSGDCYYNTEALSKLFNKTFREDIIICDALIMYDCHEVLFCNASSCNYDYEFFMSGSLPHQASFFKCSVFDRFGLYDESLKIVADWKYFIEAIYFGSATTKYIPVKICLYEGNGISTGEAMQKERQFVADLLFHPRIQKDISILSNYKEELLFIKQSRITRNLYNLIYRLACVIISIRAILKK